MESIYLSIVVCTLNRADELRCCLPLVIAQAISFDDVEILVVDNGSIDNTKDTVQSLSREHAFELRYIYESDAGLCQARNRGRKQARGQVLAFIDDDVRIKDGWIHNIRQHFMEARSDCLGGRVKVRLAGKVPIKGAEEMLWFFGETDLGAESREYHTSDAIQYPVGCNMAFNVCVFDTVGGFNTSLKYYFDETDFFRRVRQKEFSVLYAPDVEVEQHIPVERLTKGALLAKTRLLGIGAAQFRMLSGPSPALWTKFLVDCSVKSAYHFLMYIFNPTFGTFFALWFNYSCARHLVKMKLKDNPHSFFLKVPIGKG